MTIRVYIVEDHPVMREALLEHLDHTDGVEVCGIAANAETAAAELPTLHPDIVILDLSLPGRGGFELLAEVRREWQFSCVVLSGHTERSHVERALAAGASAYVLKGRPDDLLPAIRSVAAGGAYLSEPLTNGSGA